MQLPVRLLLTCLVAILGLGTSIVSGQPGPILEPNDRVVVGLNVRAQPASDATIRAVLRPGERATHIGEVASWYHVRLADGTEGWASKGFLRVVADAPPSPPPTPSVAGALSAGPDDLYIRVVDVGPGLCTVARIPGGSYLVYDAGHWVGKHCVNAVREVVTGDEIDLIILSHSDGDHIGNVPDLLSRFRVRQIIRAGDLRTQTATWRAANDAIARAVTLGTSVMNLLTVPLVPGTQIPLGAATLTLVAGWREWVGPGPTPSERLNALSVVARLDYQGRSVLFTGDTVGRRLGDPDTACKDAEKAMVDNATVVSLKADVVIAPHHGGNNGSSSCFIQAVDPQFVIFSAGHDHGHPSRGAAGRYLAHGIPEANLFRTDRGDDEPGDVEWKVGSITGCVDPRGDDDVEIVLRQNSSVAVAYRQASGGC